MGLAIKSVPSERRATAMGFFQSIYALGMFAGPAVAGLMADSFGLSGAFYTAAAVMVVATVIAGGWLPRSFPSRSRPRARSPHPELGVYGRFDAAQPALFLWTYRPRTLVPSKVLRLRGEMGLESDFYYFLQVYPFRLAKSAKRKRDQSSSSLLSQSFPLLVYAPSFTCLTSELS